MNEDAKQQLKELLLAHLENVTKEAVEAVFALVEVVVKDSENKMDDLIVPALPLLKAKVLELAEKISK